jgi:hypothetical protein
MGHKGKKGLSFQLSFVHFHVFCVNSFFRMRFVDCQIDLKINTGRLRLNNPATTSWEYEID